MTQAKRNSNHYLITAQYKSPRHQKNNGGKRCLLLVAVWLWSSILLSMLSSDSCNYAAMAQVQEGKATFYSKKATGQRTSSGERLHHDSLTCAHRSFPFGTMLRVTNPSNGKHVVVKVTDRGPFVKGRIIDLSWRAAKELDILSRGVAMVLVEPENTTIVPFKQKDLNQLPELDFESTEEAYPLRPAWQATDDDLPADADKKHKEEEKAKMKQGKAEENAKAEQGKTAEKAKVEQGKQKEMTVTQATPETKQKEPNKKEKKKKSQTRKKTSKKK